MSGLDSKFGVIIIIFLLIGESREKYWTNRSGGIERFHFLLKWQV